MRVKVGDKVEVLETGNKSLISEVRQVRVKQGVIAVIGSRRLYNTIDVFRWPWELERKGGIMKDWTGNKRTLGATLGASYLATGERPREDYYATDPDMVRDLLNAGAPLRQRVWEPACGAGHIVNVLRERGHEVCATDIVDRGCPDSCVQDFLWEFDDGEIGDVDIMTNPPYATALEFVERALACVKDGANVWMLLRLQFLEGKARRRLLTLPPPPTCGYSASGGPAPKTGIFPKPKAAPLPTLGFTGSKDITIKLL